MDPHRVDDVLHERNGRFRLVSSSAVLVVPPRLQRPHAGLTVATATDASARFLKVQGCLVDATAMPMLTTTSDVHSFRLAHPAIRPSSRFEITAVLALSIAAIMMWAVVVPTELLLRVTV
jgi:hypothetical protein